VGWQSAAGLHVGRQHNACNAARVPLEWPHRPLQVQSGHFVFLQAHVNTVCPGLDCTCNSVRRIYRDCLDSGRATAGPRQIVYPSAMGTALCRRTKQAASVRFCARIEEEDGEYRCVRYRLLLLPPSAGIVERLLQRLPQVRVIK